MSASLGILHSCAQVDMHVNLVYVNGLVYVKGFKGRSCIEIEVMEAHWAGIVFVLARKLEVHVYYGFMDLFFTCF
jgi:hypothetical protein